jgi:hypothetical protein
LVPNHFIKFFLILTLATLACGLPPASPPTPTVAPVQEVTAPPIAGMSLEQLQSAEYQLGIPDDHERVQLSGGKYQQGTDAASVDFISVGLTDFVAFGDLNDDGTNEAAGVFFENYGGTGTFGMLTIYSNIDDEAVFLTSLLIDDRPVINNIAIENGQVFLDATTHSFDDPACCPTLGTTRRYILSNNQLQMVHYTTSTPDGQIREIKIAAPLNGAEASGSVQVSGTITIAPFENNLSYTVYDEAGNQYMSGPLAVTAAELGAPGSFDETFTLEGIPPGTAVYLEIQDVSAADGTWFAMDAIKILVK